MNRCTSVCGLSLATILCLAGCSDDTSPLLADSGPTEAGPATDSGVSTIGPQGGVFEGCGARLTIPAGALVEETAITCKPATSFPQNAQLVGTPVAFEPAGLVLQGEPARLSLSYTELEIPDGVSEAEIILPVLDQDQWVVVPGSLVDSESHLVSAPVGKLGVFAAMSRKAENLRVPPMLAGVTATPEYLPAGKKARATLTWSYALPPQPAAECSLEGVGPIASGKEVELTLTESQRSFVLTCSSSVGQATTEITFQPSVAPELAFLFPSPPLVTAARTQVTWTWAYKNQPVPEPTCSLDHGIGPLQNGEVKEIELALTDANRSFTLTCTNNAGSSTTTMRVGPLMDLALPVTLDPAGGTYSLGGYTIAVPAGAVTKPVQVGVHFKTDFPPDRNLIVPPFELTPDGQIFLKPITFTIPYDPVLLSQLGIDSPERLLQVAGVGADGAWRGLSTKVDTVNHVVSAELNHFSGYAVRKDKDKNKQPLRSALSTFERFDEVGLLLPSHKGEGQGEAWQNEKQDSAMSKVGTIWDHFCLEQGLGGRLVKVVPGDFDGDGAKELAVLCTFSTGTNSVSDGGGCKDKKAIKVVFLDDQRTNFKLMNHYDSSDASSPIGLKDGKYYYSADLAVGDFFGNGSAQVVLTGSYCAQDAKGRFIRDSSVIHFFKDAHNNFAYTWTQTDIGQGMKDLRVASGDVDGDGAAETAYVGQFISADYQTSMIRGWVFDDWRGSNYRGIRSWTQTTDTWGVFNAYARAPNVALADIDGDKKAEVVFMAWRNRGLMPLEIYDSREEQRDGDGEVLTDAQGNPLWDEAQSFKRLAQERFDVGGDAPQTPQTQVADLDGDFRQEVVFLVDSSANRDSDRNDYGWQGGAYFYYQSDNKETPARKVVHLNYQKYKKGHLAVGDIDDDFRDEIFLAHTESDIQTRQEGWKEVSREVERSTYYLKRFDWDSSAKEFRETKEWTRGFTPQTEGGDIGTAMDQNKHYPLVVLADFDADNVSLKYDGEWKDNQTDPLPIIAMAAPPYWQALKEGDKQKITDSFVEFGKGWTEGTSTTSTLGVSSGLTLSRSYGLSKFILSAGIRTQRSVEQSYTESTEESKSATYGVRHRATGSYNELHNTIVFQRQDFISYKYRIVSHPDPEFAPKKENGTWTYRYVWIDQPNGDPHTYKTTVEEYNDLVNEVKKSKPNCQSPLIGSDVFDFEIGNADTYPDKSTRDQLVKYSGNASGKYDGWVGKEQTLGSGGGYQESYISLAEKTLTTTSQRIEEKVGWGFSLPGMPDKDFSEGMISEHAYAIEVGKDTYYSGAVGDTTAGCFDLATHKPKAGGPCEGATYQDAQGQAQDVYLYYFGTFVYNYEPGSDQLGFQVMSFWVDKM